MGVDVAGVGVAGALAALVALLHVAFWWAEARRGGAAGAPVQTPAEAARELAARHEIGLGSGAAAGVAGAQRRRHRRL